jgi:hypothetical protein
MNINKLKELIEETLTKRDVEKIDIEEFNFIRNKLYQRIVKKGKCIGYFVAFSRNEVGLAVCNKIDDFDKEYGLKLAIYRAKKRINVWETIPKSLKFDLIKFLNRTVKYYK